MASRVAAAGAGVDMAEEAAQLIDAAGREHAPAGSKARIVSLAPALTELCFALELEKNLAGRTDFCSRPADKVAAVPAVGTPATVRLEKLAGLGASHALVNLDDTPSSLIRGMEESGLRVVAVRLDRPDDNFWLYGLLGGLFGAQAAADTLARRFEAGLARVKMAARNQQLRRVLYLVDKNPYRTAGPESYSANLLSLVHLEAISEDAATAPSTAPSGQRYPVIEVSESLLLSVDAVLLSGAPGAFRRADLRAFAEGHNIDRAKLLRLEDALDSWYGARAIDAMEDLVDLRKKIDAAVGG